MIAKKIMFLLFMCLTALPLHTMKMPYNIEKITAEKKSTQLACKESKIENHDLDNGETPDDKNFSLFCLAVVVSYVVLPGIAYYLCDNNN
jgi:hypothetical protein